MLQACWIVEKINATVGRGLRRKKKRFLDFSHICAFFTYLYFLWFFWFIPTVHDKFFCIENWNTVQLFTFFIFYSRGNLESGSFTYMRNSVCKYRRNSAEFRGIPVLFTAKNTAEFRGIPYVFQKIPYSVGSQKRTSVDTLQLTQTQSQILITGIS